MKKNYDWHWCYPKKCPDSKNCGNSVGIPRITGITEITEITGSCWEITECRLHFSRNRHFMPNPLSLGGLGAPHHCMQALPKEHPCPNCPHVGVVVRKKGKKKLLLGNYRELQRITEITEITGVTGIVGKTKNPGNPDHLGNPRNLENPRNPNNPFSRIGFS